MNEQKISLNGQWQLYYALETREMGQELDWLRQHGERIPAQVPGNVELGLHRAGIEPDPFYGENLYRFRKYEFFRWQFERSFVAPEKKNARWELVLEGVNTFAEVFVNETKVGESHNFFIEHRFDVTDALRYGQENRLTVRIRSAVNEARKCDFPALLRNDEFAVLRMPPHSFGWDIMGRFLSAGMWRNVSLQEQKPTRILEAYYGTMEITPDGRAELLLRYRWTTDEPILDGFTVQVEGVCGQHRFAAQGVAHFVSESLKIKLRDAQLWWPKGYGQQPLYDVTLTLLHNGQVVDVRHDRIGIRRIQLDHVLAPDEAGEFKVNVNGCPILCKGSNWVPLDAFHSRDAERLSAAHDLLNDLGCNIVRCWGGNVYEDHAFFDLCDERGILVWQDFAMACAMYSPAEDFVHEIEAEATAVVKKLRNHPSILLWAGDNEVDEGLSEMNYPTDSSRYNAISRDVLPRIVRMHDPYRFYLPSSPYIPAGIQRYQVPEQHNWGARAYFKDDFYKHTHAHFISECGYHGCPAVDSLRRFLPEDQLDHWLNNPVWDAHNTDYLPFGARTHNRIRLMHDQVDLLFGSVPEKIRDFAALSQISQAEAKKFFLERTRLKKWQRTGLIWWNLLDGWPQISDAVVDYYHHKKLAYAYIKRVQRPIAVIMDELVDWGHSVYLCNDSREDKWVTYQVTDGDTGQVLLSGEKLSPANENVCLGQVRELAGRQRLYLLTWQVDGATHHNHYISGFPPFDGVQMLTWARRLAALDGDFTWEV